MPDPTADRDKDAPFLRQPAAQPPEPDPRCSYCGRLHAEGHCPVRHADAWEFAGALATALAMDATTTAMSKEKP